jgi:hypothetical protein
VCVCVCDNNSVKLSIFVCVCLWVMLSISAVHVVRTLGREGENCVSSLRPQACSALLGDNWSLQERAGHCARGMWLVYEGHWQEFGLVV